MKYKEGDKVRIKTLDWYNANKDEDGNVVCLYSYFDKDMSEFCNKIVTIKSLHGCPNVKAFRIIEDDGYSWWSDDMIKGLVIKENEITEDGLLDEYEELTNRAFKGGYEKGKSDIELNSFQLPKGYIFKDENGNVINATKIVLEKKKKEYPKTFLGCCDVLGIEDTISRGVKGYKSNLLDTFQKLLICRDAYWKIAGDEMELGKPWEPDWTIESSKYIILFKETKIEKHVTCKYSRVLAFPTEEMRDAFYEAFRKEIEICKELL